MINQSFSAENFYSILNNENRKGKNLEKEFFEVEIYNTYTESLKGINKKLKIRYEKFYNNDPKKRSREFYKRYKQYLRYVKQKLKAEKEKELLRLLEEIGNRIQQRDFKFTLGQSEYKGKKVYSVSNSATEFFAIKQLQFNFNKLYGVKQSNRFIIVNQLKQLLNDKFPKYIIRTDLKEFYEKIPNDKLMNKLNKDNLLSPLSKKLLNQILRKYETLAGVDKGVGIPRGIGISAYLAEYYMRDVDNKIKSLPNVVFYARYVDDIIVIFVPNNIHEKRTYFEDISIIISDALLEINDDKTNAYDLITSKDERLEINYLGYRYWFNNSSKRHLIKDIEIYLTKNKIEKYKKKIKLSFKAYNKYADKNTAYRHLKNRIKYLTGNTRLTNNKSNVLVGIYFSNMLITEIENLHLLDSYLHLLIIHYVKKETHKQALLNYSFYFGFVNKQFYKINSNQFKAIIQIWKNL